MKKFVNFRPVLFLAAATVLGIVTANCFTIGSVIAGAAILFVCVAVVSVLLFITAKTETFKRNLIFAAIFVFIFATGTLSYAVKVNNYNAADLGSPTLYVEGRVTEVRETDSGNRYVISDANVKGTYTGKLKYKIYLYVNGESDFRIGDGITFATALYDKSSVYEDALNVYPIAENVKYEAYVSADEIFKGENRANVLEKVNSFINDTLKAGLGEDEYPVAYAMLCGNSDYMDSELLTGYRNAGIAHIFAVSGLHINFMAVALNFILKKLHCQRYLKFTVIASFLFLYSGVCGFSSSSVRAAIMSSVLLFSDASGRKYDGLSSLSLAAIIISLVSPMQVFCAGFQLSFAVVLGIMLLSKPIAGIFKFLPGKLSASIGTVLSAQVFGIPISLAAFGEFSAIAIIANLVFVPFVGILYILTFVLTIFGGIFSIPAVALFIPKYLFVAVNFLISSLDYGIFMVGGFSIGLFVLPYYFASMLCSDFVAIKMKLKTILVLILVLILIVGSVVFNIAENKRVKMYAIGTSGICAVLVTGEESSLIVSKAGSTFSTSRLKRTASENNVNVIDRLIFPKTANGFDYQVIITRMRSVFEIASVYICADDAPQKQILEKSFPSINFYYLYPYDVISSSGISYAFMVDGYAIEINSNGKSALVVSELGDNFNVFDERKSYELTVTTDFEYNVFNFYPSDKFVVYRRSDLYKDAESEGNYKYYFN